MTLATLARNQNWNRYEEISTVPIIWVNDRAGVYYAAFNGEFGLVDEAYWIPESAIDLTVVKVTSVHVDFGATLARITTLSGVRTTASTFYWDQANRTLYIHLANGEPPGLHSIQAGVAQGFSTGRPVYVDEFEYVPLIISTPAIRQQQDIENYDQLAFINGAVVLSNVSGRLDDLIDDPVYGNVVTLAYLDDQDELTDDYTESDVTELAALFVEDYDLSLKELALRVQDQRKSQNIEVPSDRFSATAYPDASGELVGSVIPVLWGTPREIPALVTNGEVTTGNVTLRGALLLTALGTVYAGSAAEDTWSSVTALNTNLAAGEFEVSSGEGRDASGNALDFKLVAPTGIAITYLTDVITDANERFANVPFNSANYDTTEWAAEEVALSSGAYYLSEDRELFALIADIQNGANVGFRYEITAAGLRTIRVDDEERALAASIPPQALANRAALPVGTDSANLVAEVVVAYSRSYVTGNYLRVTDDGSAEAVRKAYRQSPRKEYETLLTSESDAEDRAVFIRARFSTIRGRVRLGLMGREYLAQRIYDLISVDIAPDATRPFYGPYICKILAQEPDAARVVTRVTAELIEVV